MVFIPKWILLLVSSVSSSSAVLQNNAASVAALCWVWSARTESISGSTRRFVHTSVRLLDLWRQSHHALRWDGATYYRESYEFVTVPQRHVFIQTSLLPQRDKLMLVTNSIKKMTQNDKNTQNPMMLVDVLKALVWNRAKRSAAARAAHSVWPWRFWAIIPARKLRSDEWNGNAINVLCLESAPSLSLVTSSR